MSQLARFSGRTRFFARKLQHPIPRAGLVIDVGSGGDPHPCADVVVDRVVEGSAQRTFAFRRSGHVVIADIEALPFKDNAFAYALCSHVLEHVDDPTTAAAELSRIAEAGYVETPSDIHEYMFPIGWHRWAVRKEGDTLIFKAKESPYLNERLGSYFRVKWCRDPTFMAYVWSHTNELFVQHHWKGSLNVLVEGSPTWRLDDQLDSLGDAPQASNAKRALYVLLAKLVYRRPRPPRTNP